jgi:Flp pilus assembly pilin Flp
MAASMATRANSLRSRSLARDERGAVAVEYLIITSFALVVAAAVVVLGMAQASSQERATGILISNSP